MTLCLCVKVGNAATLQKKFDKKKKKIEKNLDTC